MLLGLLQCGQVGAASARVDSKPSTQAFAIPMRRRIVERGVQRVLERLTCAGDRVTIERLECGASFDERSIRREQRIERDIWLAWLHALDSCEEPVALTDHGLDVRRAVVLVAERFPQALDGLRDAVVANGNVSPSRLIERVLLDDVSRVRRQQQEKLQVPIGKRDGLTPRLRRGRPESSSNGPKR